MNFFSMDKSKLIGRHRVVIHTHYLIRNLDSSVAVHFEKMLHLFTCGTVNCKHDQWAFSSISFLFIASCLIILPGEKALLSLSMAVFILQGNKLTERILFSTIKDAPWAHVHLFAWKWRSKHPVFYTVATLLSLQVDLLSLFPHLTGCPKGA